MKLNSLPLGSKPCVKVGSTAPPPCRDNVDCVWTLTLANAASQLQKRATAGAPLSTQLAGEIAGRGSCRLVICIGCCRSQISICWSLSYLTSRDVAGSKNTNCLVNDQLLCEITVSLPLEIVTASLG